MTFDNSASAYTVSGGSIAGLGSLTKNGTAALTLSGANSYTGGTTLNSGTLNVNNATALGAASGGLAINGGTLDNTSGAAVIADNYPLTINADFTFTGTNDLNLGTGASTLGGAGTAAHDHGFWRHADPRRRIGNGATANSIVKAGAGTLALTGTLVHRSDYRSGGHALCRRRRPLGTAPAAATPGMIVLADDTKFRVSGSGVTIHANRGMSVDGNVTLEAAARTTSSIGATLRAPGRLPCR